MHRIDRKAVFIDIDGTLIADGGSPSAYNIEMLSEAKKQGNLIILNTGRSYAFIPEELRTASYIDGIVAGGGSYVILHNEVLHSAVIPEVQLCRITELYLQIGKWCQFEGETNNYRVPDKKRGFLQVSAPNDFVEKYKGAKISKITMEGEVSEEERDVLHKWFYLYKMQGYSEGIIRGESKAGGINIILEATGIPWKNTIGIGDSSNDIEMILHVAYGIAMKNAALELKQAANDITDDCYNSGVGKAIAKHVLNI